MGLLREGKTAQAANDMQPEVSSHFLALTSDDQKDKVKMAWGLGVASVCSRPRDPEPPAART